MCTETHPAVERDLKLTPRAKVFIEGKNRPLFVADELGTIDDQLDDQSTRLLRVTNLNGEATTIRKRKVVSAVVVNTDRHRVEAAEGVFSGRRVTFRDYGAWAREERRINEETGSTVVVDDYPEGSVAVLAEDMIEALVLVVTVTGEILWENPASAPEAVARLVRAVRLVAQAETIQLALDDPSMDPGEIGAPAETGREASSYEERENALTAEAEQEEDLGQDGFGN